ncbi:MAG: hypothetical protein GY786_23465 [Proteobacteria bacterium]|nr:hypothetical protein [Pseudomonadota bacterium]
MKQQAGESLHSELPGKSRNFKKSIQIHEIHMELMDFLRQINVYTTNIAKTCFVAMSRESEGKR